MKNSILHISDLHFVADYETEGNSLFNSTFQTCFFKYLRIELEKNHLKLKYVLVSGDISNSGHKREYDIALAFLNDLCNEFGLDKKNFILCPGNHDISWEKLRSTIDNIPEEERKDPFKYHEIKFSEFKDFYSKFFGNSEEFYEKEAVVKSIIDTDDRLILIGLNSCYMESFLKSNHIGFIEKNSLKNKISDIFKDTSIRDYDRLLILHHNPDDFKNNKTSNANWYDISLELGNKFPALLCGHIHKSKGMGEIRTIDSIRYSASVGSFAKIEPLIKNSFNLMYCENDQTHQYNLLFYEYETPIDEDPYWQHHDNKNTLSSMSLYTKTGNTVLREITISENVESSNSLHQHENTESEYKETLIKQSAGLEHAETLNRQSTNSEHKETVIESKAEPTIVTNSDNILDTNIDNLLFLIQNKKLFKSGHFHWSETFRSHGIIDINYLISNKESINLITHLFNLKIKEQLSNDIPDLILGIGIEGNVIGARLSALYPKSDYSFIPDAPKDNDFSIFERNISLGTYKRIILLKDILFKADALKDILKKDIFIDKEIYVISLFYCGSDLEETLFSEYTSVKHFTICNQIKINTCKHEGPIELCPIIKHKLDNFYPLYATEET